MNRALVVVGSFAIMSCGGSAKDSAASNQPVVYNSPAPPSPAPVSQDNETGSAPVLKDTSVVVDGLNGIGTGTGYGTGSGSGGATVPRHRARRVLLPRRENPRPADCAFNSTISATSPECVAPAPPPPPPTPCQFNSALTASDANCVAPPVLDMFAWPPPTPTKMERIPPRLCNDETRLTLGAGEARIRAAFLRAGYPDNMRTYMIGNDGIAVVGAMEAIQDDARYLPGNRRFLSPSAPRAESFEIGEFVRELFSRNTGHYRIIVIALTPKPSTGPFPAAKPDEIRKLPAGGNIGELPPVIAARATAAATPCYGIVYEFERPQNPANIKILDNSLAEAKTHIVYAGLWPASELR